MPRVVAFAAVSGGMVSTQRRTDWAWWSLLPLGLGAWVPIYAGVRARRWFWWFLGIVWSLLTVVGWVMASGKGTDALAGGLIIIGWVGAIATSFTIRHRYEEVLDSSLETALQRAERRLAERDRARRLARDRPALALEMGIGRPDKPGAHDAGLVDVNNASGAALTKLPGVDDALATKIVESRAEVKGFTSVEDLGIALDLDATLVEDLRDRVVFLPR